MKTRTEIPVYEIDGVAVEPQDNCIVVGDDPTPAPAYYVVLTIRHTTYVVRAKDLQQAIENALGNLPLTTPYRKG